MKLSKHSVNYKAKKRLFDIILCLIFSVPTLILVFIGILVVLFSSKGPLFFSQIRVGENGKLFKIFKIRTMIHNHNNNEHTQTNDKRIFFTGRFLRKTKIDELPQLFNILKGDMSFVGPRPETHVISSEFEKINPSYKFRYLVKPGLTGLAQIYNPIATPKENIEKLEFDLKYIENMSLKLDLIILIKTTKVILTMDSL